jgi:HlyD family secretion protein
VGLALALGLGVTTFVSRESRSDVTTVVVREGRFVDTIVETGTLTPARLTLYTAPLGGQWKIVELVPEGTSVAGGDLLARFDDSALRQAFDKEEALRRQLEAERLRAREELRLEGLQAGADLTTAQHQVQFAERDLANEQDGKGKLDVAQAESALAEARREVQRTSTAYEDTKPLLAEGFITRAELDRGEQAWRRAEEQERLAALKLEALVRFERPAALGRTQAGVNDAREGVARARESAGARLGQRQATVAVIQSRLDETLARIAIVRDQMARTTITAQNPGLVVYRDLFFGSDRRKPQVGDEVWANQPLIAVPDSSQLIVETRVREVDLHKVTTSQRVTVTVDAYPDLRLPASVALVGALAQEDPTRAGTKYFPVTVRLLAIDPRLRTGMTARVEIEVAALERALLVPLEAVFGDRGQRWVMVASRGRTERRNVEVKAENDTHAAVGVGQGLAAGDRVAVTVPVP